MVLIDADVGGVAAEIKAIDPGLKVRFAEAASPPFWAVYHESEDRRTTQLILTAQAVLTASGTWSGLDSRIVERVREIDAQGRGGYDFAKEIQAQNERAVENRRRKFRESIGETVEQAAHALRKDRGTRYKGRAFIPKDAV